MKYSIIIATYNRLAELKELIQSVEAFEFPKDHFELLISDDGSNDGTKEYIDEISQKTSINLPYISQANKGPGAARNHGMEKAKGDYFIFIDSDCIIPADYLNKIDAAVTAHQYDAFGGPDTYHPSFSPLLKAINYSMTSFIGTGGTRGSEKSVAKFYPRSFNMGIHRTVFETIGGMGELRHGQDMDFSARIYDAGFKVGLISNAFVYHKRRTSLWKFFKQIFNWGVARINLSKKHPSMLKPIHFAPAFVFYAALAVLLVAPFLPFGEILLGLLFGGVIFVALFAFLQSLFVYKNIQVAFLSIITLFLQVFAYALGTSSGLWQMLRGKNEAKGFTRNYYK